MPKNLLISGIHHLLRIVPHGPTISHAPIFISSIFVGTFENADRYIPLLQNGELCRDSRLISQAYQIFPQRRIGVIYRSA